MTPKEKAIKHLREKYKWLDTAFKDSIILEAIDIAVTEQTKEIINFTREEIEDLKERAKKKGCEHLNTSAAILILFEHKQKKKYGVSVTDNDLNGIENSYGVKE